MKFKPKRFFIGGLTWADFSEELSNLFPSVLNEISTYLTVFPTVRPMIEWIRFDFSTSRSQLNWFVSGKDLSYISGNFATADIEIGKNYSLILEDGIDDDFSNEMSEEYENQLVAAITNSMAALATNEEVTQQFVDTGWIMKLKIADSRNTPWEIFPVQTRPWWLE